MKNILTILAILVLLAACAPQAPQVTPAAQPPAVIAPQVPVEQSPALPQEPMIEQGPAQEVQHAAPKTVDVQIKGFKFIPAIVTVNKGDTIRWTNYDGAQHTATGDGLDTGNMVKGQSSEITFDKEGAYEYICTIHPSMKGQVVVQQ